MPRSLDESSKCSQAVNSSYRLRYGDTSPIDAWKFSRSIFFELTVRLTSPLDGVSTPQSKRTSVDFPAPFSPVIPMISPFVISKFTPENTVLPAEKLLSRFFTDRTNGGCLSVRALL